MLIFQSLFLCKYTFKYSVKGNSRCAFQSRSVKYTIYPIIFAEVRMIEALSLPADKGIGEKHVQ